MSATDFVFDTVSDLKTRLRMFTSLKLYLARVQYSLSWRGDLLRQQHSWGDARLKCPVMKLVKASA